MPNLAPRLAAALDPFAQPASRAVAQLGNWELEQARRSLSAIAADLADHDKAGQGLARARDDEPAPRRLAERIEPAGQPHRRAEAAGDAALGQRDRDAALGDVVGAAERPRPDARPDRPVRDPDPRRRRRPAARRPAGDPAAWTAPTRQPTARTARPARSRRPRGRTRAGRRARRGGACRRSRPPASGRSGRSGASLYSDTLPPTTGTPSASHASASPSTASTSCQATCGFSGLPKFRQLVSPSGSAPTQARLAAHSYTASAAPRRGSQATRRPLPSIATAIAGRRRAARARPRRPRRGGARSATGRSGRTARTPAGARRCWASASSASSVSAGDSLPVSTAAGASYRPRDGRRGLEVVQRAVVDEHAHRQVGDDARRDGAPRSCRPRSRSRSSWPAPPSARTRRAPRPRARARPRTASAPGTRRP